VFSFIFSELQAAFLVNAKYNAFLFWVLDVA